MDQAMSPAAERSSKGPAARKSRPAGPAGRDLQGSGPSGPADELAFVVRTPAAGWVELTAPSREEHLQRIDSLLDRLAEARLDEPTLEDVKIAVSEIASNAVEWGNRGDASRRVQVSYGLFDDELVLKVEDEGEGFDPGKVPDPAGRAVEIERERIMSGKRLGGFGIYVARKLMDHVIYNERGNVVILTKSLTGTSRPAGRDRTEK